MQYPWQGTDFSECGLQGGHKSGGVSKMWAEIIPHMARAVTMNGGDFTHCVYSHRVDLAHAKSTNCRHRFSKVLSMVLFYSECSRTLTFQNVCNALQILKRALHGAL